ncbi:MAG: glucose-1-phosphate cytidylyltransferase [Bacteroidetes bacterium]|nr:glucose-1-phosphate cytidylyltransferase [Bacteroidota bacterium]
MKVMILAGGMGTRLSEETSIRPKPMVEIGGKPILWHIMKIYSHFGFNDFVILSGYMGYYIKEYFATYYLHNTDVSFDLASNSMTILKSNTENWKVTVLDTGINTMTGGRIKKAKEYIDGTFMLTYGDGVANIDINELLKFHKEHKCAITMTTAQPEGRFGSVDIDQSSRVLSFQEKPKGDEKWINGGFFVCEPEVFDYIDGDETIFEKKPLETLASENKMYTYKHKGFWKCMDTLSDKQALNKMWENNTALWKIWE